MTSLVELCLDKLVKHKICAEEIARLDKGIYNFSNNYFKKMFSKNKH